MKVLKDKEGQLSILNITQKFILSPDCGKYNTRLLLNIAALGPKAKDNAVGFAANQLRVSAHCFLAKIDLYPDVKQKSSMFWKFFANCEIIDRGDIYLAKEECLSIPNETFSVERYNIIVIEYMDRKGNHNKETYTGINAQIIQHEVDHCNGILINNNTTTTH
jgi:peptide deformylase